MFYKIIWYLCKGFCFLTGRVDYYGKENLYEQKPFLLIANHRSNIDPLLVGIGMKRQMAFLAKDTLFKNAILNWGFRKVNARPIKREGNPKDSINQMVTFAKEGKP